MDKYTKWIPSPVRRPDAAYLFNAVRLNTETGQWEEARRTPSHSESVAARVALELNRADPDKTYCVEHGL